jgi:hypothetical protein
MNNEMKDKYDLILVNYNSTYSLKGYQRAAKAHHYWENNPRLPNGGTFLFNSEKLPIEAQISMFTKEGGTVLAVGDCNKLVAEKCKIMNRKCDFLIIGELNN